METATGSIDLNSEEAKRCWLSPTDALDLAFFARDNKARVLLNNLAAKKLILSEKEIDKKTSPRLYSLESMVQFAVYWNYTQRNSDFDAASLVSEKAVEYLHWLLQAEDQQDLPLYEDEKVIVFGIEFNGSKTARLINTYQDQNVPRNNNGEYSRSIDIQDLKKLGWIMTEVMYPHYLIERILERYALKFSETSLNRQLKS